MGRTKIQRIGTDTMIGVAMLVTLAGIADRARAQGLLFRNDVHRMVQADSNSTYAVELGDVDGDGDLDAFLGNGGEKGPEPNRLYLNGGNGVFTDAPSQVPPDSDATYAVALGDVDGDGDLDVFVGNAGQNRLYLNDGNGVFTDATSQIPADTNETLDVALGDVDGDGDLDALLGTAGQNRLYLNDGNGNFTNTISRIPPNSDYTRAVALGDIDGDGDLDAFLGNGLFGGGEQNRLYLNNGSGVFTDATSQIPLHDDDTFAIALGDVDGDGDLDAFLGNGVNPEQDRLYLNDGNGVFTDATSQIPAIGNQTRDVALADADGDGDLDVFLANESWNHLYLNDGNAVFTNAITRLPAHRNNTQAVALGDVDGDADLDLFLGNGSPYNGNQNRLYLNDGTGTFVAPSALIPVAPSATSSVAMGDVDGDGDPDALLANWVQNRLYLNEGNGVFTDATSQIPPDLDYSNAVALGDLDGDGDLDAFVGNEWGGPNRVYLNEGNGVFTDASSRIPPTSNWTWAVALGDVDGDGDLDALVGNGYFEELSQNRLYLNDGNGFFTDATAQIPADSDGTAAIALGDLDGDGDLDAFLGNGWYSGAEQNRLYLNDGNGVFTDASSRIPADSDATRAVALGDVDGDGDLDVFVGNCYGFANRLYLNDGNAVFTDAPGRIPSDSDDTWAVALGDVDGDGNLDAFVGNIGQNRLYVNLGNGYFVDMTTRISTDSDQTLAVALGDLDDDGDEDALAGNYVADGRVYANLTRQLFWRGVPRIGKRFDLDLYGPPAGTWILGVSKRTAIKPKPPRGILRIDPRHIVHSDQGVFDPEGHAVLSFDVPDKPSQVGRTYYWQALVGQPDRLTNLEITTFTDL